MSASAILAGRQQTVIALAFSDAVFLGTHPDQLNSLPIGDP
jgi:hypothetical protein